MRRYGIDANITTNTLINWVLRRVRVIWKQQHFQ